MTGNYQKGINLVGIQIFILLSIVSRLGAQPLDLEFENGISIGGRENAPVEYLFGGIREVVTDRKGRIYVGLATNEIRVYTKEGHYIKTLGGSGRGPGEFREITSMEIREEDKLLVLDRMLMRATEFQNMGAQVEVFKFNFPAVNINNLVVLRNGDIAFTYVHLPTGESSEKEVIRIYSSDFSTLEGTFFNISQVFNLKDDFERSMAGFPFGYLIVGTGQNQIALSTGLFDGRIYLVNIEEGSTTAVEGNFAGLDRYKILSDNPNNRTKTFLKYSKTHRGISSGSHGYIYQRKLVSECLLSNSRWILNFVQRTEGKKQSAYFIEIIDHDGNYIGYTRIDDNFTMIEEDAMPQQRFYPKHLDEQNNLYFVDYSSGTPVLRTSRILLDSE